MTTIKFERKEQYGMVRFFPIQSPESEALQSLTGRKCFDQMQLARIARIGVKVEQYVRVNGELKPV